MGSRISGGEAAGKKVKIFFETLAGTKRMLTFAARFSGAGFFRQGFRGLSSRPKEGGHR